MSTKKIREALGLMKEIQGYSSAELHAAALAETEAIEKAAESASRWCAVVTKSEAGKAEGVAALRLFEEIRKDMP